MPRPAASSSRADLPGAPGDGCVATISRRAAERLLAGHVWVYRSDVEQPPGPDCSLAAIVDSRGRVLGSGLWSPDSQIALRLVSSDPLTPEQWLALLDRRLEQAIQSRSGMLDEDNDACRLVFSEADQLPGLIVDRYGELVLFEILSRALDCAEVRDRIVRRLRTSLDPSFIFERSDPRIRELEGLSEASDTPLHQRDSIAHSQTIFHLTGLAFHYNSGAGQKTGAFLDQRWNYAAAAAYARGEALDVCTYQGGFALHLARSCSKVTGVDISRAALEVAEDNLAVNRSRIAAEVEWIEANAFDLLRDWSAAGRTFDAIVLDPPAFAKSKRAVEGALRGYKELNLRAFKMLRPGATLVTCSCSQHVSWDSFHQMVSAAAGDARRRVRLLERRGAGPDHPVILNIPETEYLKCLILAVE